MLFIYSHKMMLLHDIFMQLWWPNFYVFDLHSLWELIIFFIHYYTSY